jgi:hypothetical protein
MDIIYLTVRQNLRKYVDYYKTNIMLNNPYSWPSKFASKFCIPTFGATKFLVLRLEEHGSRKHSIGPIRLYSRYCTFAMSLLVLRCRKAGFRTSLQECLFPSVCLSVAENYINRFKLAAK